MQDKSGRKTLKSGSKVNLPIEAYTKRITRMTLEWFRTNHIHVVKWPSSDPNPTENLQKDFFSDSLYPTSLS